MSRIHFTVAAAVQAPPDAVYAVLSDYRGARARTLPPEAWGYTVHQGGYGAGTIYEVSRPTLGSRELSRIQVQEPEPGRALEELDLLTRALTTYSVVPAGAGGASLISVNFDWELPAVQAHIYRITALPQLRSEMAVQIGRIAEYVEARFDVFGPVTI